MNVNLAVILLLLAAAVAMFALNRPRMDAVALLMMAALPFTGVITMREALAGFADPNIVLIALLFVMGESLVRTGVAQRLGDWLTARAGRHESRLLVLLMGAVGLLGSIMSSTGVVAIFIPVVLRISQRTGTAPSSLMMPLSVAALISGMMTLVATAPNLVVNAELTRHGATGFQFFSFSPFGIPVLILGIVYMLFARRWLAAPAGIKVHGAERASLHTWIEQYQLAEREHRVRVGADSPVIGRTIEELQLRHGSGASIVAIERADRFSRTLLRPGPKTELRAGDILLVDVFRPDANPEALRKRLSFEALPLTGAYFADRSQEIGMAELMLTANSEFAGRSVTDIGFRTRYGLTVIGLRHGERTAAGSLAEAKLKVGDTLLVIGLWKDIERLRADHASVFFLNLPKESAEVLPAGHKLPQAVFALLLMVGLMIGGWIPNVQAALIACLVAGALGCVDFASAYRSIHWKTLVLIVGMLPFSLALQRTGGVELAANALMAVAGGAGPHVILGSLFLITAILGLFISNTATAVLMAPVALAVAKDLHASPYPFAMIVALAASTAFMTPISSPVNTLVVGPGAYKFGDFVKVGTPLSLAVMVVCVVLVPLLLPLYP